MRKLIILPVMMIVTLSIVMGLSCDVLCLDSVTGQESCITQKNFAVYPYYVGFDNCRNTLDYRCAWNGNSVSYHSDDNIDYYAVVKGRSSVAFSVDQVEGFSAIVKSSENYTIGIGSLSFTKNDANVDVVLNYYGVVYEKSFFYMIDDNWHRIAVYRNDVNVNTLNVYIDYNYVGNIAYVPSSVDKDTYYEGVITGLGRGSFFAESDNILVDDVVLINREPMIRRNWESTVVDVPRAYMLRKPTSSSYTETWYKQYTCGKTLVSRDVWRTMNTGISVDIGEKGKLDITDVIVVKGTELAVEQPHASMITIWYRFLAWIRS